LVKKIVLRGEVLAEELLDSGDEWAAVWRRSGFIQSGIQDSKMVETAKDSEALRLLGTHKYLHSAGFPSGNNGSVASVHAPNVRIRASTGDVEARECRSLHCQSDVRPFAGSVNQEPDGDGFSS
jgi:hypothetical protein